MSKQIEVLKFMVTETPGKRPYKVAEVAYKSDGKTKGMKVLDFVQREVFASLMSINPQPGDILEVEFSQNDKGFWQFSSVAKGEKVASVGSSGAAPAAKTGNWETSTERAARQVMIVRQSSLSNAVALSEANKAKSTPEDIIAIAKVFEAYVLGTESVVEGDSVE